MTIRPMSEAPRDGSRFLLCYYPRLFSRAREWERYETKWEECRWIDEVYVNGSGWNPWCGNHRTKSSTLIAEEDCVGWLPRPEEKA